MVHFTQKAIIAIAVGILVVGVIGIVITVFASSFIKTETTFSASPTGISTGSSAKLTWNSTRASSCEASGAWSGKKDAQGSESVIPHETATYSLTCYNARGIPTISSLTITVNPKAKILSFTLELNNNLTTGQTATINWSTVNAVRCTASGGWSGNKALNGTETVSLPKTDIFTSVSYDLNCYGRIADSGDKDKGVLAASYDPTTSQWTQLQMICQKGICFPKWAVDPLK